MVRVRVRVSPNPNNPNPNPNPNQAALDDAATEAVLLAAPRPVDDHAGAELALGRCRQLGVERGVGRRVAEVKLLEPSALTLSGVVQTNVAAAAIAQAGL